MRVHGLARLIQLGGPSFIGATFGWGSPLATLSWSPDGDGLVFAEKPTAVYPAHGPRIDDGAGKIREYIAHRLEREQQVLAALRDGIGAVGEMVKRIYAAYPVELHAAVGLQLQQVGDHGLPGRRVARSGGEPSVASRCRLFSPPPPLWAAMNQL